MLWRISCTRESFHGDEKNNPVAENVSCSRQRSLSQPTLPSKFGRCFNERSLPSSIVRTLANIWSDANRGMKGETQDLWCRGSQGGGVLVFSSSLLLYTRYELLLFLTFSALVANPKKTTLHGGQSRSWSAEQGKKEKVWQRTPPPPPPARCSFGEKIKIMK